MNVTVVNSGKKIAYCESTLETMMQFVKKSGATADEVRSVVDQIKTAATSRVYNVVAAMATDNVDTAVTVAKTLNTYLETLKIQGKTSGASLITAVNRVMPIADSVVAGKRDFPAIPDSAIEAMGLEENYTPEMINKLTGAMEQFIEARKIMIDELYSITTANVDEDTREVYSNIGKAVETFTNNEVVHFAKLKDALMACNMNLGKLGEQIDDMSAGLKNMLTNTNVSVDISGQDEEF